MSHLFEPARIGSMTLRNRFVRSATWEAMATPEGTVTPRLVDTIAALARGGVGLIISSHAYVSPEGQAGPGQIGAYKDELSPGLKQMAAAARDHGAKILLQLAHAGYFAAQALTGRPPPAVSAAVRLDDIPRRELTTGDIQAVVRAFAAAAARAKTAGFDGVQIHSAHGYLLNQFLSPLFNRRSDEYGGALQNRVRVHLETLRAVRAAVGEDYPVLIKLNGRDFIEGGLEPEDAVAAAVLMEAAGLDAVELSSGMTKFAQFGSARQGISSRKKEAYNQQEASPLQTAAEDPPDPGGRHPLPARGRAAGRRGCVRLHCDEPALHPRAGSRPPLAVRRPPQGRLHLRQPLLRAGAQRGGPLLRHGCEEKQGGRR